MVAPDSLARLYLFQGVPLPELRRFADAMRSVRFNSGERLFRQGDAADLAWLLVDGRLVVTVEGGGETRTVGDVRPGELLGETALYLPGARRSATVTASAPSTCLRIDPATLDALKGNLAVVALERQLLGVMSRRLRATNLAIQRAWKEQEGAADAAVDAPSFGQRLRALFRGRRRPAAQSGGGR